MDNKTLKVGIFVDSKQESGGAYQELLYSIQNFKKYKNYCENIEFKIICTSKKIGSSLNGSGFKIEYFSMNLFERYVCFLRNNGSLVRRIKKFLFFKNKFESFLKKIDVDLIYFVAPGQYMLYLENTKYFVTVPDVCHRVENDFPDNVDHSEFQRRDEIFEKSLPRAIGVFTNTQTTKEQISFFYKVDKSKIKILNHQPSFAINNFTKPDDKKNKSIKEKFNLPKEYVFYPAMYLPHKNHKFLLEALNLIKTKFNKNINVVFCGNNPKVFGNLSILKNYAIEKNLINQITFLNFIEDEDLPYLYLNSSALIMVSQIGPSNIPPWEGFKMNVPVLYTKYDSENIFGDAVLNVDPLNLEDIANCLIKITEDKNLRDKLIKNGTRKIQETNRKEEFLQIVNLIKNYSNKSFNWKK